MRLATWNVERPRPAGWKVPPAQLRRMSEVDADIWVLTETHLEHRPTDAHAYSAFSPPHPERRPEHERWVGIWSKWPLSLITDPPPHPRGSVAALIAAPAGPIVVYGTVLAWANERTRDDGRPARMWDVLLDEIARQAQEWSRLRESFPEIPLVVAGDFNQDRDGSGWYGTATTRARLDAALRDAGLVCATAADAVTSGLLDRHHLVDHVCLTPGLAAKTKMRCWESVDADGTRLSDHPVVAVDLPCGEQR